MDSEKLLKKFFPKFSLKGCYFHYIKNLWTKAKIFGLYRKKFIEKTRLVIFSFKIITFIKSENTNIYFEQLKTYINNYNEETKVLFNKFMKYYFKTWIKSQFIHFDLNYNENMACRTNN